MLGGQHSIWVSMDGVGEYHDAVRGKGAFVQDNLQPRHFTERTVTLTRDHNSVMALMLRPQSAPSRRAEKKSVSL